MQLLSNQPADRRTLESKTLAGTVGFDEIEWEGFGEEESEEHVHALTSNGKVPVGKDTCKSEKKHRKQDKKQKNLVASQPKQSKNTFEVLGIADDGDEIADDEEGDGEQKPMIKNHLCPLQL